MAQGLILDEKSLVPKALDHATVESLARKSCAWAEISIAGRWRCNKIC